MYSRTCTGSSVPSPPGHHPGHRLDQADAIASLIVVALMLKAAWELLRDSGWILLEAAPKAMDLEDMRAHLLATEHVRSLHAWTVTSSLPALSRIS